MRFNNGGFTPKVRRRGADGVLNYHPFWNGLTAPDSTCRAATGTLR